MPALVKPPSISWAEVFKRTWREAGKDDVFGRSAQLAYYFFLALFPLLICVVTVLGVLAGKDAHVQDAVLNFLAILPGSAFTLIQKTLTEVDQAHATSKLSIGLIFSLWSASAGMSAIMDTLNAEHEVHDGRSFIKRNAVALGLTLAVATLLIAAVAIVLAGGTTAEAFAGGMGKTVIKIAQWPVAIFLVLLGFALTYLLIYRYGFRTGDGKIDMNVARIGTQMLGVDKKGYALPFEVVSILLLAAMIGCIVIAMKTQPAEE